MHYFDLLLNYLATAAINITPVLVIRYFIRKRRFDTNKPAIISCAIIAVAVWVVIYIIAFSNIGSNIVPKGEPEIIFAFVNYYILKPKTASAQTNTQNKDIGSNKNKTSPITDENMKAYADIMLEEEPVNEVEYNNCTTRITKVSIALNVLLVISLIGVSVFCFSIKNDLDQTKIELADAQERYERAKKARESMMEQHQEEIDELINRFNPGYEEELTKALEELDKKRRENEEKWNRENPDDQISGVMPID